MTRREAREETFILIFEKQFNDDNLDSVFELATDVRDIMPNEYIKSTFFGTFENLEVIDSIISKYAVGWSINRISKTSLAVLRLAIYEIKFIETIPISVSINEAVELCKKYATKEDASFVNGILSSLAKEIQND